MKINFNICIRFVISICFVILNIQRAYALCEKQNDPFYEVDEKCECNLKEKPWLDATCRIMDYFNPNHACRYSAYIKSHGNDPFNPKYREYADIDGIKNLDESFASLAWTSCEEAKKIRCAESGLLLTRSYKSLVSAYFDGSLKVSNTYDLNVDRNFKVIVDKEAKIQNILASISDKMPEIVNGVSSYATFVLANKKLLDEIDPVLAMFSDLSTAENRFTSTIKPLIGSLNVVEARIANLSNGFECEKYTPNLAEKYKIETKGLFEILNRYSSEILESRNLNNRLYNETYRNWKYAIYKKYAEVTGKKIDDILDELNRDLMLDRVMWKTAEWWSDTTVNGLAGRLHTKYFYYTEPLRILYIKREEASKFKDIIYRISGKDSDSISQAIKSIDENIMTIDRNIEFIKSKGWSGLLSIQRTSAEKRALLLPNNELCQKITKSFLDKTKSVKNVDEFDQNSSIYKQSVDICIK